jgi:serine/threonine protein kinase
MKEGGADVAIKISRNKQREVVNAQVEARILKQILGKNPDRYGIVKMIDSFQFRSYFFIVFELLEINLYRYIKAPNFTGMKKENLRLIAT